VEQAGRVAVADKHNTRCKPSVLLRVKCKAVLQAPQTDRHTLAVHTVTICHFSCQWGGGIKTWPWRNEIKI